jgi:hypothetical protein
LASGNRVIELRAQKSLKVSIAGFQITRPPILWLGDKEGLIVELKGSTKQRVTT